MTDTQVQIPSGLVAMTSHGIMQSATAQTMWEMRSVAEKNGLGNIRWEVVPGALIDKCRNDACRLMLQDQRGWVLFIDADMIVPPNALLVMLQTAFHTHAWADVVGGLCHLRSDPYLPTIDTGTGTWESVAPQSGVKEVIRTGGAFLLIKRHVLERIPQPWFALRVPMRPLDAIHELDNFARIKFDGTNPFRSLPAWDTLERIAKEDPSAASWVPSEVGEDSSFCDRVKAHGMRIVVDTRVEIGHLSQVTLTGKDHQQAMQRRKTEHRQVCGIY